MLKHYNKQPTILIGLGGAGGRIVDELYGDARENGNNVSAFIIDTDKNDVTSTKNLRNENVICIASPQVIDDFFYASPRAGEWFPDSQLLLSKSVAMGACSVRALSRLKYECVLNDGEFAPLIKCVERVAAECIGGQLQMRVNIVTGLAGGTGSGIFLQTAMLVRSTVARSYNNVNLKIQGDFILPGYFNFVRSQAEKRNMEANTYAAMMELNAISEHVLTNGPSVELEYGPMQKGTDADCLPYDYCFLYDRTAAQKTQGMPFEQVKDAIWGRLFAPEADFLNDKLVWKLSSTSIKRSDNFYGTAWTGTFKYPEDGNIQEHCRKLESEAIQNMYADNGEFDVIGMWVVPANYKFNYTPQYDFVESRVFFEPDIEAIRFTAITCGMRIDDLEKFRYQHGDYYLSYQNIKERIPLSITPHLDSRWHETMHAIGAGLPENGHVNMASPLIPEGCFVFISYSSKELEIAEHTKNILETNNIKCWMAPKSIPPGSNYDSAIPRAIDKCTTFILILSEDSQGSIWVSKEVKSALSKGKTVIPFRIDNSVINDSFDFMLIDNQRIEAYNRMAEAYQELVDILKYITHKAKDI